MEAKLSKQQKLKELLELKKKSANPDKPEKKLSKKNPPREEVDEPRDESDPEIQNDEIDGQKLTEIEDMDEEVIVPVLKKKHLLKHFAIKQTVESFFTGGNLHFCKTRNVVYAQRDASVVRFNLETRLVETEISHVL